MENDMNIGIDNDMNIGIDIEMDKEIKREEIVNKKVKYAIHGFGIFAEKRLIPGFKQSNFSKLVALSKRNITQAREKANKYGIKYAYDSLDEMLKNVDIDVVYVCTPNAIHRDDVIKIAKARKHVIVEKPMAMNSQECKEMIDYCEKYRVKLMIAQCMRYNTTVLYFKKAIKENRVGNLIAINMQYHFDGNKSRRSWLFDKKLAGGGPIMDIGVHCLDTIRFLLSSDSNINYSINKISVYKDFNYPKYGGIGRIAVPQLKRVETYADINLEHFASQKNKGNQEKDLSNNSRKIKSTIQVSFDGEFYTTLEIIGTEGAIRAEYFNWIEHDIEVRQFKKRKITTRIIKNGNCYSTELDDFSLAILNNLPTPIPGREGLKNQEILDWALRN